MGSTLRVETGGRAYEIWSDNLFKTYNLLLHNPTVLRLNPGEVAKAALWETAYGPFSYPFCYPLRRFWKKTLDFLAQHQEFGGSGTLKYGYDWRQSLLDTAPRLASAVEKKRRDVASDRCIDVRTVKVVFLTHSMGGLLTLIALAHLDVTVVDRVIHIGCPLEGAPTALRSAYDRLDIPLFREISGLLRSKKNHVTFLEHLFSHLRTFPSLYQLLPPCGHQYLIYTSSHRTNPLNENIIDAAHKRASIAAHREVLNGQRALIEAGIPTFTIYTENHAQEETEMEYRVQQLGLPNPGYRFEEIFRTCLGDGTVLADSARGSPAGRNPIRNVSHAYMGDSHTVVQLMPGLL